MASRVKPRPPYDPNYVRQLDRPESAAKRTGSTLKRKKPMRKVSLDTAKEKRDAKDVIPTFLLYNPVCACGCGQLAECPQHIAAGSAGKAASRFDTDLILPSAMFCNSDVVWHDPLLWPKPKQLARKLVLMVQKFNAANAKRTSIEEVLSYVEFNWDRVQEIIRERNGG